MPPPTTVSHMPCPKNGKPFLTCQDCVPQMELYEVTGFPSFVCTFGKEPKRFNLSPSGKYRLLLTNEDQASSWSYRIEVHVGSEAISSTLLSQEDRGKGQIAVKKEISFYDPDKQ